MVSTFFVYAALVAAVSAKACPNRSAVPKPQSASQPPALASASAAAVSASAAAAAASRLPPVNPIAKAVAASSFAKAVSAAASPVAKSVAASTFSRVVSAAASAAASPAAVKPRQGAYPFTNLVAYGDELSDNGNGSFTHGFTGHSDTGEPDKVYGFGTWTNGPVAVSYLNDLLGLGPSGLLDYSFGGCCGGGSIGATLDNGYTKSDSGAQSLVEQISNYTGNSKQNIGSSLQFIWIGQNDLSKHTNTFWLDYAGNKDFATEFSTRVAASVKTLLDAGAPYVFVANIYPKHIAPVTAKYLCGAPDNDCVKTWGKVIQNANTALEKSLGQFGDKVIYYDSFKYISDLATNAVANGFTRPIGDICDGAGDAAWDDCITKGNYPKYFWLNFVQPTTRVYQMIAVDMKKVIDKHFNL